MSVIFTPAADCATIERLTHLPSTGCGDCLDGAVEVEATRFPIKAEKVDQTPSLISEIRYQGLIFDL